jgi:peroxiredoxin
MSFASRIGLRAATQLRPYAIAVALLGGFSASLYPVPPQAEPADHKVECVTSPLGSATTDHAINAIDQAGNRWELRAQKGRLFIVAFLAIVPDTAPTPSRSQVVSIQSMQTQYARLGVGAVVIDESGLNRGSESSQAERVNAWYDWHLDPIPLLADDDLSIAKAFNVCNVPTTLLIDSSGRVLKRWDSLTNAGTLAQEIQAVLLASQTSAGTGKASSQAPLPSKLR